MPIRTTHKFIAILFLAVVVVANVKQPAEAAPAYTVVPIMTPPVIDGKLNDEVWKHVRFLHLFDFLASTTDVKIKADPATGWPSRRPGQLFWIEPSPPGPKPRQLPWQEWTRQALGVVQRMFS